jgi:hypothetical protein
MDACDVLGGGIAACPQAPVPGEESSMRSYRIPWIDIADPSSLQRKRSRTTFYCTLLTSAGKALLHQTDRRGIFDVKNGNLRFWKII